MVSIIVPVYNCENYIKKCLESICTQSYKELEIIVINDGSTDNSEEIIREVAKFDDRIRVVNQENKGVSVARNQGVELANGKYMTFIDGDDYIEEFYIENFVTMAEQNNAQLCICGYTLVDGKGRVLSETLPKSSYVHLKREEYAYRILATLSRFYRTDFWKKNDIKYTEDKTIRGEDIPIALLTNAIAENICYVEQKGYYYVQHNKSARNNMKGLHTYRLPCQELERVIECVMTKNKTNGKDFFELGIFRVFVTFLLDLGVGASKEVLLELVTFESNMIKKYFSRYYRNKALALFSGLDIPFSQKTAVKVYIILLKYKCLPVIAKILSINLCKRKI